MKQDVPLNEKIRILTRLIHDIIDRNRLQTISQAPLSQNQFLILKILYASGSKRVSEVADLLHISRPAASKNIDYLVKNKLVARGSKAEDRRSSPVDLLHSGKELIRLYNDQTTDKISSILAAFDQEEKRQFNKLLDKYIHYLIEEENQLELFCLQCGGKFEGQCPVGEHKNKCYFHVSKKGTAL